MAEKGSNTTSYRPIVCYAPTMITTNGIWQGDNPLDYALPLFVLQLTLIILTTRFLVFVMKPFRQPRVIPEILGGIILGPSILGQSKKFAEMVFPLRSVMVLETMANVGILYFLFLVGVEMDIVMIKNTGKKALVISSAGMILPFLIGVSFAFVLHTSGQWVKLGTFIIFLGVSLSVTAFPVLARILAELKLLNTDVGKIAMASALINDMAAWILLALAIAIAEDEALSLSSLWVLFSSIGFVLFCFFAVRPMLVWILQRTPEGEAINEFYICLILTLVMLFGFITDAMGTHAVFGAFVFGLIIPNGPIGVMLIEKLEDFVSALLLPIFFAINGLKTDITTIKGVGTWMLLALVIVLASLGKVTGTLLASLYCNIPFHEGLTLGLLMNTKGLLEMIVLNVGKDQKVLDDKSFAILIVVATCMTAIVQPAITNIQKPGRKYVPYKRRTVQQAKPGGELRLLVCIHTPRNVPTIIHLLEATNATKNSPIRAYILHLLEVTGRQSAMLIVHNMRKLATNQSNNKSYHIFKAFENFVQQEEFITLNPLTAISPPTTMHEDICGVAEDKHVTLIVLPFHKQQTVDGGMEVTNPAIRTINVNVLDNAPCSVAILVDRGFNGPARSFSGNNKFHHVAVLFFGGPDDREALAFAWRLSEHQRNNLTILRFTTGENTSHNGLEEDLDEKYINKFCEGTEDNSSVAYMEREVSHGEETVGIIRSMNKNHDLVIVGRGRGVTSPVTAGLSDWCECPELGAIGDLLASPDFTSTYSVLVVQQYQGDEVLGDVATINMPESPNEHHNDEARPSPAPEEKIGHQP
ncbi:cation/H(+) antiporter 15-like [Andrographis paniculata]|uniref:cation/H(+) antiporter 15-like n=1 Tax=Andrographis paniculata TaxID=175694 RepID=UPI0021E7FB45|nr:cation/H(+) antiporter 15-like [Andrographis paniculata]